MDAAGQITLYNTLFYVSLALTILGLGLAVFFFFYFDIRTVRGYLSGSLKRKSIEEMNEKNLNTGDLHPRLPNMSGPVTSGPLTAGGRVVPPKKSAPAAPVAAEKMGTTVLSQDTPETAVLVQQEQETVVLTQTTEDATAGQNYDDTVALNQDYGDTIALNQDYGDTIALNQDYGETVALNQNQEGTAPLNSDSSDEAGTTAILSRKPENLQVQPGNQPTVQSVPEDFTVTENTLVIHTDEYI